MVACGRAGAQDVAEYVAQLAEAELVHKRHKVATAEAKWLKDLEAKAAAAQQQRELQLLRREGGEAAVQQQQLQQQQGRGGWGMGSLHRLIDSVLGNLQLVLTNVHIRWAHRAARLHFLSSHCLPPKLLMLRVPLVMRLLLPSSMCVCVCVCVSRHTDGCLRCSGGLVDSSMCSRTQAVWSLGYGSHLSHLSHLCQAMPS